MLKGGEMGDPEVELLVKQISLWLELWWQSSAAERHSITAAWRRKRDELQTLPAQRRWRKVTGPMAATIVTLLELEWYPMQPNFWITPDKQQAAVRTTLACQASIVAAVRRSAEERRWRLASHHWGGGGMERGVPDFTAIRNLRRVLCKKGQFAEVAALNAVACGGSLVGERLGIDSNACSHCGATREDAAHRYYLCPSLRLIPDEDGILAKTKWIASKVETGAWAHLQCLWSRAIVPGDVIGSIIEEDSDSILEWCLGSIQEAAVASGAVFSDGSGGEAWVPQQIRRVGAGSASVDFEFDGSKFVARSVGVALSEVRGKQTVPRAELAAAELAFRVTPGATPVLWSDARYVVDGANSSRARQEGLLMGSNGDGWGTFFDMYKHEERPPVRKVKAHQSISAVYAGKISMLEYVGNHLADAAADAAAQVLQSRANTCQHVERWTGIAYLIAHRLSFIEAYRWRSISRLVPEPVFPEVIEPRSVKQMKCDFEMRIAAMGHVLRDQGAGTRCLLCLQWRHRGLAVFWETTPCEVAQGGQHAQGLTESCEDQFPVPSRAARARLDVDDSDGSVPDRDEHVSGIDEAWSEEPTAAEFCLGGAEVPRLITRAERDRRRREYHLAQRVAAKKTKQNATKARDAMRHSARGGVWTDSRTPTATGLHSTHLLRVCGGVVFCLHCGGTHTGAGGMRGLLPKPCPKRVAPGSVDRLSKLKQGWLPRGLTEWPDAAAQPADQRAVRPAISKVV